MLIRLLISAFVVRIWHKQVFSWRGSNEPSREIMALFVLSKLILQTRMRSHPVGLDVWFLVGPFIYFHTSCVQTEKALARLRRCAGSPEPSLLAYVISTMISWAGSNIKQDKQKAREDSSFVKYLLCLTHYFKFFKYNIYWSEKETHILGPWYFITMIKTLFHFMRFLIVSLDQSPVEQIMRVLVWFDFCFTALQHIF